VWLPHVALGLTEIVAAFVTKLQPADRLHGHPAATRG
jgi:hypothetical protein